MGTSAEPNRPMAKGGKILRPVIVLVFLSFLVLTALRPF
jgi:hypothetical protein